MATSFGCRSLHDRGPASSEVISCRHKWQQGLDAMQHGRLQQAEALFASAVESCSHDERARQYYADTLWKRGAYDEAIDQMNKAVELSGGDAQLLVGLGEMYLTVGEIDAADRCATEALARQPGSATAWALRGDIQWERRRWNDALASYHRALSIRPQFQRILFAVAQISYHQERPEQGLATLQQLIESTGHNEIPDEVLRLEGLIYGALGRHDDAVESFRQVVHRGRSSAQAYFELADAEFRAGRHVAAHWSVQEALSRDSTHQASHRLMDQIGSATHHTNANVSRLPQQANWEQPVIRQ